MNEVKIKNSINYRTQIEVAGKRYVWADKIPIKGDLKKAVTNAHKMSKAAFYKVLGIE